MHCSQHLQPSCKRDVVSLNVTADSRRKWNAPHPTLRSSWTIGDVKPGILQIHLDKSQSKFIYFFKLQYQVTNHVVDLVAMIAEGFCKAWRTASTNPRNSPPSAEPRSCRGHWFREKHNDSTLFFINAWVKKKENQKKTFAQFKKHKEHNSSFEIIIIKERKSRCGCQYGGYCPVVVQRNIK